MKPDQDANLELEGGLPSLREVLAFPAVRAGAPELLTGHDRLDRTIRWVHVSELTDIGSLLRGGELVLSTGIGLPSEPAALRRYVAGLVEAEVGALVVELGRRYSRAPDALVAAAAAHGLPLAVLHHEVRFVEITEAIHTRIVDARVRQLHRSDHIHRRFTELTVEGASLRSIVDTVAELCGCPVVLENLAHQVITFAGDGVDAAELLAGWERRSRSVRNVTVATEMVPEGIWTLAPVGARGERWGRLIAIAPAAQEDVTLVLERGAAALAVNRLSERDETAVRVRAHQEILTQLLERSYPSLEALDARAGALGVPLVGRQLLGVAIVLHGREQPGALVAERLQQDDVERVVGAAAGRLAALVDIPSAGEVRLLVSLPPDLDPSSVLTPFARAVHEDAARTDPDLRLTIGVGSSVDDPRDARRSLNEAAHVAAAAPAVGRRKAYFELLDVRVRGLIHVLRDDPRLQHFVERELAALVDRDAARGSELLGTLEVYLDQGRNKSATATALQISRPALYTRLRAIGEVLDADLEDPETCLSLHVAVLGLRSLRS